MANNDGNDLMIPWATKNPLNMRVVFSGKGHPMPFRIDRWMSVEQNWKRKRCSPVLAQRSACLRQAGVAFCAGG